MKHFPQPPLAAQSYRDIFFSVIETSLNPMPLVVLIGRKSPHPLLTLLKKASHLQA